MKKNYFLMLCSLLLGVAMQAQVNYTGNGNSGFGDVFGSTGSLDISDDGTTINYTLNRGAGNFNDAVVIYIDSKTGGFSDTSTFDDTGDDLRKAVSGYDGTNRAQINFPSGFTADYAIAINVNGIQFGGLWELAATGAHTFIQSVNVSPNNNTSSATYTFDTDFSELGTSSTNNFKFVATYLNQGNAFRSDEAIGDGISGGNPGNPSTVTFTSGKSYPNTWTGATDSDWVTATNWTEGVPATTHNVHIPAGLTNYPTSSGAVTINKGTIKSGASLIAGDAFTGTLTYERALGTPNWYLVSSPVEGETIEDLIANNDIDNTTGTGGNIGLAPYDNTQALATDRWDYQTAASTGALMSGVGYSVKFNSAGTLSFTGTMNVDNETVSITNNTGSGGTAFNLVGNPYPSFLAANNNADATNNLLKINDTDNDFLTESTIWLWNQGTSSYEEINQATASFHVAPGQSFFVSSNGSNTFSITEAMQSHQGTETFQKSANTRTELKLAISNGTNTKDLDIFYIDGTTTGFDNGFDSSIFSGVTNSFAVYTEAVANSTGKKLGIQSLPNADLESMVIPVGIIANAGEITFTAEALNLPSGLKVFLEDRTTNTFTRLDEANSNYKVTLTENTNGIGRFYLHTKSAALSTNDVTLENVSVYAVNKSTLKITGLSQGKSNMKVFNVLGKQVFNASFQSNGVHEVSLPNLSTGLYIVQLENESGKLSKKIVLE